MINLFEDTIAAISTGVTNAGIGIVRISGDSSIAIADKIFRSKVSLKDARSHMVYYGHIYDNEDIVDEVLVTVFRAPRSYTREDVVEISSHGGSFVLNSILKLVYKNGARPAEPGEFTKRAFLSGRIDLSQAEAVMEIISSDSRRSLDNSQKQLNGILSDTIASIREEILSETAFIEAALDDPEHYDLDDAYNERISSKLQGWLKKLNDLIGTAENGRIIRDGIKTVIAGRPNVGKSSLLNLLAKEERAIVTDVAGTTRDIITEKIRLSDMVLAISDTAGIRESEDKVEAIGVERSLDEIRNAQLVLFVMDITSPLTDEDKSILSDVDISKTIFILNKSDKVADSEAAEDSLPTEYKNNAIIFSAKTGFGVDKLVEKIHDMYYSFDVDNDVDIFITNDRHVHLLKASYQSLSNVDKSIKQGITADFFTIDLMDAYTSLGLILGIEVEDDLVDKIFSEFCMGK